jgi:hypothetical protein
MLHLKFLEKQNRQNTIMKERNKNKDLNQRNTDQKSINKTKSWFFEKIKKIDKPLANLTNIRTKKTKISKIRKEKRETTTNTKEMQGIIRDNFEILCSKKLENLEEMDKFLDAFDNTKLNQ